MSMIEVRGMLQRLEVCLRGDGNDFAHDQVNRAQSSSDEDLAQFIVSDELWGGSGSIADQAAVGVNSKTRREVESLLAELGQAQIKMGLVNARTEMWTRAFRRWQESRD